MLDTSHKELTVSMHLASIPLTFNPLVDYNSNLPYNLYTGCNLIFEGVAITISIT